MSVERSNPPACEPVGSPFLVRMQQRTGLRAKKPEGDKGLNTFHRGLRMILDILTVLFSASGFVLVFIMLAERRRDVLHGPYLAKTRDERVSGQGPNAEEK